MTKIRVGIETRSMTGNMTGIGNYSFHLIQALIDDPTFEYVGFGELNWSKVDAVTLHHIALKHSKVESASASDRPGAANTVGGFSRYLAKSYLVRLAYRKARSAHFASTVRRQELDLFHATNFLPPADPGVQVLPVVYDLSFVRYPSSHPAERRRWLDRMPLVLERSPLVQTISEFSRSEIEAVYGYPREKIFVASPAASPLFRPLGEEITRRDTARYDLAPSSYLLAVGTLEPRKNLTTLISAYANLSSSDRNRVPLVIAGGAGWGELGLPKEASTLVRTGQLRFLGMVPDAHLRSLYEGAIALLFPSIYEGFGMPVVEAMACGTPVVHSSGTAMDEITGDLCPRVPALDVRLWSSAMRNAMDQATGPANDDALIQRARTYSWSNSAKLVKQAYLKMVRETQPLIPAR